MAGKTEGVGNAVSSGMYNGDRAVRKKERGLRRGSQENGMHDLRGEKFSSANDPRHERAKERLASVTVISLGSNSRRPLV